VGKKSQPFNNPFAAVGPELKRAAKKAKRAQREARRPAPARDAATPAAPRPPSDAELFEQAVSGARPLRDPRGSAHRPLPPPHAAGIPVYDEDAEAYAELVSLVEGRARFDICDSDEFIEGGIEGLDRRILARLSRGDFAFRDHLDLHGMTRDEARKEVEVFLAEAHAEGRRCVLIVHGRGHNSKDNIPVLKTALKTWLERGRIARRVLAFCTARPCDGGAGAMYVLLRR
jgi:DNA-nicking Smr family endonuclease